MGISEDMKRLRKEIETSRQKRAQDAVTRRQKIKVLADKSLAVRRQAQRELADNSQWLAGLQRERLLEIGHRVQEIRRESRELVAQFRHNFNEQSKSHRQQRLAAMEQYEQFYDDLVKEVGHLRASFRQELIEQKHEDELARRESREKTHQQVEQLRRELNQLIGEYQGELTELRHFWNAPPSTSGPAKSAQPHQPQKPASTEPPSHNEPPPESAPNEAKPGPSHLSSPAQQPPDSPYKTPREPDDLERIVGIGPSTKEVLYEAGLFYFDDLATMSPDSVTEMLGNLARFANVEHWIEQAREIISKSDPGLSA